MLVSVKTFIFCVLYDMYLPDVYLIKLNQVIKGNCIFFYIFFVFFYSGLVVGAEL